VIYGYSGSYAETYANNNNIPFVALEDEITKYIPSVDGWGFSNYTCETILESVFYRIFDQSKLYNKHLYAIKKNAGKGGLCEGLALTSALTFLGTPAISDWGKATANSASDFKVADLNSCISTSLNMSLDEFVQSMWLYQFSKEASTQTKNNKGKYQEIITRTNQFAETGLNPIAIIIKGPEGIKLGGHVLIPYKVRQEGTTIKLYVYDCNYLGLGENPDEQYIELECNDSGKVISWSYEFTITTKNGNIVEYDNGYVSGEDSTDTVTTTFVGDENGVTLKSDGSSIFGLSASDTQINASIQPDSSNQGTIIYESQLNEQITVIEANTDKEISTAIDTTENTIKVDGCEGTVHIEINSNEQVLENIDVDTNDNSIQIEQESEGVTVKEDSNGDGSYDKVIYDSFNEVSSKDIASVNVEKIADQIYTGKAITPSITVKDDATILVQNTDYTVTFENNINAKATGGKLTYKSNNSKISISNTGKVTIAANYVGTATITITAGDDNYETVTKNIKITVNNVSNTITASNFTRTYSTKQQTFSIGAKRKGKGKLTYSSNNAKVKVNASGKVTVNVKFIGKATITIKVAANGIYKAAAKKITVTVNPTKTSISKVTNTKGKKLTISWKKNTVATGYQIQYSTSKTFSSGNKAVTITKNSTTSKTITGLTKGKNYYVRIRIYKSVSGKKYYSGWSTAKNLKISK
jgi:hypothetical protein